MTIPTDGRIDLDALAELAKRLRREAEAFDNDLGSDPEADAGTARLLREAAGAIDLARRAAIPSEQGEAVAWDCADDAGIFCTTHVKTAAENIAAKGYTVTPLYHHPAPAAGVKVDAVMAIIDAWMEGYDFVGTGSSAAANAERKEWEKDRARILSALDQGEPK